MIKTIMTLCLGIIIGIFILDFILNVNNINEYRINSLELQNDSLIKANLILDSLENTYIAKINEANYEILKLESQDNALDYNIKYMNKEINIIKTKYEKARNYANDFGSYDLKRYFSELK